MRENLYRLVFLILLIAICAILVSQAASRPINLVVYPRIVVAGLTTTQIRVQWRIERHPDNRNWSFVMNSDNGDYQLSSGQIEGEDSPAIFPICTEQNQRPCYRTVHAGSYVMEACVYREKRFCDRITLEVR